MMKMQMQIPSSRPMQRPLSNVANPYRQNVAPVGPMFKMSFASKTGGGCGCGK